MQIWDIPKYIVATIAFPFVLPIACCIFGCDRIHYAKTHKHVQTILENTCMNGQLVNDTSNIIGGITFKRKDGVCNIIILAPFQRTNIANIISTHWLPTSTFIFIIHDDLESITHEDMSYYISYSNNDVMIYSFDLNDLMYCRNLTVVLADGYKGLLVNKMSSSYAFLMIRVPNANAPIGQRVKRINDF